MGTLPVLIAMRTSIGVILIVAAIGLVLGGIGRVLIDVVTWYKDHMLDPYRDLRKNAKGNRNARKTLEEVVNSREANRRGSSDDDDKPAKKPVDTPLA